jgi:Arm DNA-binding domain
VLTDAHLKALRPKEKLYKIVNRDGMYVVIQPAGAIVFRYDYRLSGRRETLTIGRYGLGSGPIKVLAGRWIC